MSRSKVLLLFLVIFLTAGLVGCTSPKFSAQPSEENPGTINISYVSRPINLPSIVAREKGLFENEFRNDGIDVKWHNLSVPSSQLEALASKSLDFSNSLNYVSAILAKANGNDIKIISAYSRFPKGIALVVRENHSIDTAADLKGKTIALQKGTMLYEMLVRILAEANLSIKDVELTDLDSPAAAAALAAGHVDASILPEPLLSKSLASGQIKKLRSAEGLIPGLSVIAVRSEFAQAHPDLIKRYLKVHRQSLVWSNANQEEALALAAQQNQMDITKVKALYPLFNFEMTLEGVKNDLLKSAAFLQEEGMISADVDINKLVDSLIDSGYLPEH